MKTSIHIGSVAMPLNDFVVSRNAILGITKSGKSYTAKGLAEQLLELGVPIVVFDPIGVWRYLKVPGDGAGARGWPVVVAGGEAADLPLTPHSAPEIVRAAIRENVPLVIDLYDPRLSKGDWRKIVAACFRTLLYENTGFRHIFLEEAAEYIPQKVYDTEVYAEVEKLARMGGNKSLGLTLINQRAQEVNKAVLDLCDNVVLLRQRGSHAIDSLEKWMDRLAPEVAREIATSLPSLTSGDCWVFTELDERPVRTRSKTLKSFHPDRRNPEQAKLVRQPVDAAKFVAALSGKLQELVNESKANDPAALRQEIARLKKELAVKPVKTEVREVPALDDSERKKISELIFQYELFASGLVEVKNRLEAIVQGREEMERNLAHLREMLAGKLTHTPVVHRQTPPVLDQYRRHTPATTRVKPEANGSSLGRCERALLAVLARYPSGCDRKKLILLAGYCWSGSTQNALGRLRSLGYVIGSNNSLMQITQDGLTQCADEPALPAGTGLRDYWVNFPHFGKCERDLLAALFDNPKGLHRDELLASTGYTWSGSTQNALGALRTAGVIVGWNSEVMRVAPEILAEL